MIYFIPSDLDTIKGYKRRLSEILLYDQNWYKTEMQRIGFGEKTFGLFTNAATKRVKIITIRAKLPKSSYPYNGGVEAVQKEVDSYFADHQADQTSDHNLIIIPTYVDGASSEPSGGPFFGYGRSCFALDYADFDLKYIGQTTTLGKRFIKWFGGLTHELGHGLNLSHNQAKVSEVGTLGTVLMGAGNYTFGQSPTFLSLADCAKLNTNEVFNVDTKKYYGTVNASIKTIQAKYDTAKGAIIVSGTFSTDTPVTDVVYFNDPNVNNEGVGVNRDYNAVAWSAKPNGVNSFYIEEEISDLEHKEDNIPYELKVALVHDNGTISETIYYYTFLNGLPVFNFNTRIELNKQDWTIASFSSQETSGEPTPNGPVANVIDGKLDTYWHSNWSVGVKAIFPHEFVINMGSVKTVNGLSVSQRVNLQRAIKTFDLWVSIDGINFTKINYFNLENRYGLQYFDFVVPVSLKYFKFIANSSWDGEQFASLAEIGMY
ncbi:discoidin domain-containing protein [Flavobacterium gillisiae]|uniref:discoidin domain-containing protein n=1 Tax=Flavobacterium gillisiae TaxID=150146 RepID=UPI0015A1F3A3|nr:discoidin domain-containing protein [Flavobacterium gillisiae]